MAAAYMNLFLAIVCEVIATSCLKQSEQFTRLWLLDMQLHFIFFRLR
mgnify:CR=1 FL=1